MTNPWSYFRWRRSRRRGRYFPLHVPRDRPTATGKPIAEAWLEMQKSGRLPIVRESEESSP